MKKYIVLILLVSFLISCEKKQDPFVWNKDRIGHLTKDTPLHKLDSLYANDSLVRIEKGDEFSNGPGNIELYEKGGAHLLSLTPYDGKDSTSTIEYVRIHDKRFKTEKGITNASTFKDINAAYKVSDINNMISDAQVRVDSENFYFTVDKDLLPATLKFDLTATIEESMIPDDATTEYMFISW